jgi:transposase
MQFDFIRPLTAEEYAGLKADIAAHGQHFPIVRDQNGVTLDGHHRERILTELDIPERVWKIDRRSFGSDKERRAFVLSANVHRRQLTTEDRKHLAEQLYANGKTQAEIGKELGVSQKTVSLDLKGGNYTSGIKTASNPKGAGRPKGKPKSRGVVQAQRSVNATPEEWDRFKEAADKEGVPAADKLGSLVRNNSSQSTEKMVSIHVLIEALQPLSKRVQEQANRHAAMVDHVELAHIAGDLRRLLDEWASDDPTVRRVRGRIVPASPPRQRKAHESSLQADQQRNRGSDPTARR